MCLPEEKPHHQLQNTLDYKVKPRSDQVFRSAYHFTGGEECDKTTPSGYNQQNINIGIATGQSCFLQWISCSEVPRETSRFKNLKTLKPIVTKDFHSDPDRNKLTIKYFQ